MGGMLAIAVSLLGLYLSTLARPDSALARAIPGIFLAFTSFVGAWIKSALPRLTLATRIASLVCIWLLIVPPGQAGDFLLRARDFVWIVLVAAVPSLVACLMVLRWSSAQLAHDVAEALKSLHQCLQGHLDPSSGTDATLRLHQKLLQQTAALSGTYFQASFELRIGRVGVKSIKPLIGSVEHLRRALSWGTTGPWARPEDAKDRSVDPLHDTVLHLSAAILHALLVVRLIVLRCYNVPSLQTLDVSAEALQSAHSRLTSALKQTEAELAIFGEGLDFSTGVYPDANSSSQGPFGLSLFAICLLQMAHESVHALKVAESILDAYETSRPKLWHPRFTLAWLGAASPAIVLEDRGAPPEESFSHQARTDISTEETKAGLSERGDLLVHDDKRRHAFISPSFYGRTLSCQRIKSLFTYGWNHPSTMSTRLTLSRVFRSIAHSNHLKHAFKNSIGVALLSLPAFLHDSSPARHWFFAWRGHWMVLSFALVLDTNQGATWRTGYLRVSGTILGALCGFVVALIAHRNPYAIVVLITLAEIPMSWIVTASSFPPLGTVANLTLPPIIFTDYLNPDAPSVIKLAWLRALMISLGVIAALLVNSLLYPRLCRVLFLDSACQSVGLLTQLYTSISRELFQNPGHASLIERRRRLRIEWDIRKSLHRMSVLVITMNDELSLVPKPMRRYRQIVACLQRLLDLLTGLRKIREHIPRQHAVAAVANERRELVSCICVSLFACEQVFGARQPLPQFLPSSRKALMHLEERVGHHLQQTKEGHGPRGLSIVYTLAEAVVLADVVRSVEELSDLCRQLFGTTSWFSENPRLDLTAMISTHEEVGSPFTGQ
ncbi:hypothetical protein PQX77_007877 [Marasmius sp. AFHP31]|nr:hypothetical protein PQX77_007877 [Marasmius sp. AFHP31]